MDWSQFRTILWLRRRIAFNQWTRGSGLGAIFGSLLTAGAILSAFSAFSAGTFVGARLLADAPPHLLTLVWDGLITAFAFFWLIGIATELQRSETVDLPRLMHLPVSLREAFLINYLASHVTLSLIIVAPAMAGLITGLSLSRGPAMLLLVLPAFGFLFAVTAWTYCLRGWLAGIMLNARRKRSVIVWVTIVIMVIAQAPNLYFNVVRPDFSTIPLDPDHESLSPAFHSIHRLLPPLWPGYSAGQLALDQNALPALFSGVALFLLAALGFHRAYSSTVRFYSGTQSPPKRRPRPTPAQPTPSPALDFRLPGQPDEVSAVATATLRSLLRAPELKMAAGSLIAMMVIFGFMFFRPAPGDLATVFKPWSLYGVIVLSHMLLNQLYANQFGADRDGFRAYVLSPGSGRDILLGKNLAMLLILICLLLPLLTLIALIWKIPAPTLVTAWLQSLTASLIVLAAGNFTSIYLPYHLAPGTLKPTKTSPQIMLALLLFTLALPLLLLPVALPLIPTTLALTDAPTAPALASPLLALLILTIVALVYWITLPALGRCLERRQLPILEAVTHPVE